VIGAENVVVDFGGLEARKKARVHEKIIDSKGRVERFKKRLEKTTKKRK